MRRLNEREGCEIREESKDLQGKLPESIIRPDGEEEPSWER